MTVLVFIKQLIISIEETSSAVNVASATPATSILNTITNIKFNITFTTPATIRNISGLFVSPMARNMAAPKLYKATKGILTK